MTKRVHSYAFISVNNEQSSPHPSSYRTLMHLDATIRVVLITRQYCFIKNEILHRNICSGKTFLEEKGVRFSENENDISRRAAIQVLCAYLEYRV